MTKTIELPCFGIVVEIEDGGGTISSDLKVEVTDYNECDYGSAQEEYNTAMDAIESVILAHACAGIDIKSPAYIEGIEVAVQSCADNI